MAQRLDRFQQHRTSTRNFLEWLVVAAASIVLAAFTVTSSAGNLPAEEEVEVLAPGLNRAFHRESAGTPANPGLNPPAAVLVMHTDGC